MKTKLLFISSAMLLSLTLASCSQDSDAVQEQERSEVRQSQSVSDLTLQLKEYNSRFTPRKTPFLNATDKKPRLSWWDWLKVGIADVKGALSGTATIGGWVGSVVGAAVASIQKYVEILDKNRLEKEKKELAVSTTVFSNGISHNVSDSIGYYHNTCEEFLYDCYNNRLNDIETSRLVTQSGRHLAHISDGYRKGTGVTAAECTALGTNLDRLKALTINDAEDFFDYLEKVKGLDESDSDYLDFTAEYLYTCVCSNVGNIRDYTTDVLRQIDGSNVASSEKATLSQCIVIAYSSLVYSSQMECINITTVNQ